MFIQTEATPNPDTIKFLPGQPVAGDRGPFDFPDAASARISLLARALFSAKEAAFKCQFPLTGRMLEFDEIAVRFDVGRGTFEAEFVNGEVARKCGRALQGRARVTREYVACATALTAD